MNGLIDTSPGEKCTVIESICGQVKLIKRSRESCPALVTLSFSNLEDCLEYINENHFQLHIIYSGMKKREKNDLIAGINLGSLGTKGGRG